MKPSVAIFLSLFLFGVVACSPDYYWRPFDGTIPSDALIAVPGATPIFIGNVYYQDGGLYVGQLRSGVAYIEVTGSPSSINESPIHVRYNFIQILCTRSPELFDWIPANATTLNKLPYRFVEAGYEATQLYSLGIGRINYNNGLRIGKISGGDGYFIDDRRIEVKYDNYEVLVYKGIF